LLSASAGGPVLLMIQVPTEELVSELYIFVKMTTNKQIVDFLKSRRVQAICFKHLKTMEKTAQKK
jgi:hypothetical protein